MTSPDDADRIAARPATAAVRFPARSETLPREPRPPVSHSLVKERVGGNDTRLAVLEQGRQGVGTAGGIHERKSLQRPHEKPAASCLVFVRADRRPDERHSHEHRPSILGLRIPRPPILCSPWRLAHPVCLAFWLAFHLADALPSRFCPSAKRLHHPSSVILPATLTVTAPILTDFSLSPSRVPTGSKSTATVFLSGPAGAGGVQVPLLYDTATLATVRIAPGSTTGTATLTAGRPGSFTLTARSAAVTRNAVWTVTPLP